MREGNWGWCGGEEDYGSNEVGCVYRMSDLPKDFVHSTY